MKTVILTVSILFKLKALIFTVSIMITLITYVLSLTYIMLMHVLLSVLLKL